jgi:hypothetical protein
MVLARSWTCKDLMLAEVGECFLLKTSALDIENSRFDEVRKRKSN